MEEFTEKLKEEMSLLDDRKSQKGQELRKELGIDGLDEKGLAKYKIDFIAKHMGQSNLYCFERNDYFRELLTCCIDKKGVQYITPTTITCITDDSKPRIFWVFTDNEDKSKIIYSISDKGDISQVFEEDVKQQFLNGMRTLSKSKEGELKEILLGNELTKPKSFSEQQIGKATVDISITKKNEAQKQITKDEQELDKKNYSIITK